VGILSHVSIYMCHVSTYMSHAHLERMIKVWPCLCSDTCTHVHMSCIDTQRVKTCRQITIRPIYTHVHTHTYTHSHTYTHTHTQVKDRLKNALGERAHGKEREREREHALKPNRGTSLCTHTQPYRPIHTYADSLKKHTLDTPKRAPAAGGNDYVYIYICRTCKGTCLPFGRERDREKEKQISV